MKTTALLCALLFGALPSSACVTCNRRIQDGIFNSAFFPNLGTMLSAFFVLAAIVAALAWAGNRRHTRRAAGGATGANPAPLTTAATILGIGLGGFADGIILHQILQWHNMLSAKLPPDTDTVAKSVNMFWDGVFHFFTLCVTLVGIVRLWRVGRLRNADKRGQLLAGGLLLGWGIFNLVEGVIDHQILKLHNVREQSASPEAWNMGFLLFSLLLIGAGWALTHRRRPTSQVSADA